MPEICNWTTIENQNIFIHRFDPASYTCRCKKMIIEKEENGPGGWRGMFSKKGKKDGTKSTDSTK